jgi:hypothetical protein
MTRSTSSPTPAQSCLCSASAAPQAANHKPQAAGQSAIANRQSAVENSSESSSENSSHRYLQRILDSRFKGMFGRVSERTGKTKFRMIRHRFATRMRTRLPRSSRHCSVRRSRKCSPQRSSQCLLKSLAQCLFWSLVEIHSHSTGGPESVI